MTFNFYATNLTLCARASLLRNCGSDMHFSNFPYEKGAGDITDPSRICFT